MREIVLDTETTGLDPRAGHRLVEIGCVEIVNKVVTGRTFHVYLNPQRSMPIEAFKVHGLSDAFLSDKPLFKAVAQDFLSFIGEDPLVAHNAAFDAGFLNHELGQLGLAPIPMLRVVDTLAIARRRHPGAPLSLDALCQRYGIDNSRRVRHGALLDAEILAEVYAELSGGRQSSLALVSIGLPGGADMVARRPRRPIVREASAEERSAHDAFVATLSGAIWLNYPPA